MNVAMVVINVVALAAILLALTFLLTGWGRAMSPDVNLLVGVLMVLLVVHNLSNTLEWTGVTAVMDIFEDYILILTPLMGGFFLYSFMQHRAEEDLREREGTLQLALDSNELGTWEWNPVTNEIELDEKWRSFLGFDVEELEQEFSTWEELVHPEDGPIVQGEIQNLTHGEPFSHRAEFRMRTSSGDWKWIRASAEVVERDDRGSPVRVVGLLEDVDEEVRADQRVEQLNQLLNSISNINEIIVREDDIDDIIDKSCQALVEGDLFLSASIVLMDEDSGAITHNSAAGKTSYLNDWLVGDTDEKRPASIDMVMKTRQIQVLETGRCSEDCDVNGEKPFKCIFVPLLREGEVIGILRTGMERTEQPTEDERKLLSEVAADLAFADDKIRAEEKLHRSFINVAETTSRVLGVRDIYTQRHEERVARIAKKVAERMGLDEDRITGIYLGGILHDIGKIAIPETILTKTGELSDLEWDFIRNHPEVGRDKILQDTDFPWPVEDMTLHHHERLDGSGYPDGLEGDELSTEVRILGAVDVVEAMSAARPYRAPRSKEEVLEVLEEGKGEKFDPEVVEVLVDLIEEGEIEFE